MANTPIAGGNSSLAAALEILTLLNTASPIVIQAVKDLLTKMDGKSDAEILADADSVWQKVIDTARAERAKLPSPPPES